MRRPDPSDVQPPPAEQTALQRSTLNLYGELLCRRADWGSQLVFAAFTGAAGTGLSAASSIAGAASLVVDDDAASVHANNRDAAFDFVVNTLDESLRTLKNEIRRGRPLAVALLADPVRIFDEAAERGVCPRFILSAPHSVSAPEGLVEATHLAFSPDGLATAPLEEWLRQRKWSPTLVPWPVPAQPGQSLSHESRGREDEANGIRANWRRNLSRYQRSARRSGQLWAWLTPSEARQISLKMDDAVF